MTEAVSSSAVSLEFEYPKAPLAVPQGLTKPTIRYKRHAWLAFLGIFSFVTAYFGLCYWFFRTSYLLFTAPPRGAGFVNFLLAGTSGFLAIFLLKGLFGLTRARAHDGVEILRSEQPRLFAFIDRLADDARAPRAHRVYLSARVNAAVFYDVSLVNLVFPSKKNLEIGLGLVNGLSLSEFKAVLAHEFGHFAQRSMAVGRWIYIAQQVAGNIIAKRDFLDKTLSFISRFDLRVAWIGWLLQLFVWSIRSIMDTFFSLVILGQRSLSREMEFQADLVSVQLCGSNALIEALHRLGALDEAFDEAVSIAIDRERHGVRVPDLFEVQSKVVRYFSKIYADPSYGEVKKLEEPATDRLFGRELAEPPRMWSTHPSNRDREDNAKARYVACDGDERSAWLLFDDSEGLRGKVTEKFLHDFFEEPNDKKLEAPELKAALNERYEIPSLDERYQGLYLGRSPVLFSRTVKELFESPLPSVEEATRRLETLYPSDLRKVLEEYKTALQEHVSLTLLKEGILTAPGGIITHKGRMLRKKELPAGIEAAKLELDEKRSRLETHDRAVRSVAQSLARDAGEAVARHHRGLVALLHFTSHQLQNIRDAQGLFQNTLNVVFADGRVSSSELERVIRSADVLWNALWAARGNTNLVKFSSDVAARLGEETYEGLFGEELGLSRPDKNNINDWFRVSGGWVNQTLGGLSKLERETLQCLLELEDRLRLWKVKGISLDPDTIEPAVAPASYPTLAPGEERERQRKLDLWDRFHAADGLWPTLARLAVAGGIIGTLLGFTRPENDTHLFVENGLNRPVRVDVDGKSVLVAARSHAELDVTVEDPVKVSAATEDGETIEAFETEFSRGGASIYNVASAAPLVTQRVRYGKGETEDPTNHGNQRILSSDADYIFVEPPKSIQSSGAQTKTYFHGLEAEEVGLQLGFTVGGSGEEAGRALVLSHVRWDPEGSPDLVDWIGAGIQVGAPMKSVIEARLAAAPNSLVVRRALQDLPGERAAACSRDTKDAAAHPESADLAYLAARCLDSEVGDNAFAAAFGRFPEHAWLGWATTFGALERNDIGLAKKAVATAMRDPSLCGDASLLGARIRRLTGGGENPANYAAFKVCTGPFARVFEMKSAVAGIAALEEGQFEEVRKVLVEEPSPLLTCLLGASEGVLPTDRERALELFGKETTSAQCNAFVFALATREAKPLEKPLEVLERSLGERTEKLVSWVTERPWRADAHADSGLDRERELGILLALIADPTGVPSNYRTFSLGYWFPGERPHFAPARE